MTYRRRYRGSLRTADALDLLLLDRDNPRSLAFALGELGTHLAAMPASTGSTRPERLREHLESALTDIDITALTAIDGEHRTALTEFLVDAIAQLEQLAEAVAHVHFESGPPPLALSSLDLIEERERA